MSLRFLPILAVVILSCAALAAPDPAAAELARQLAAKQEGSSYVRLRMAVAGGAKETLQLQIKSRVSRGNAEIVYQVLFPKERKGEAVLLRKTGGRFSGAVFTPSGSVRPLGAAQMDEPLFGSELTYEDVVDSPFTWDEQAIVGEEAIDRVSCQILESRPGKGHRSSYASVRTWVDPRRIVPLRIEKYGEGGRLLRRISTTRILLDGDDSIPANLAVRGPRGGAPTELDGSRIKRGVAFADAEFTPEGLKEMAVPRGAPE
jgi:hypothetical protein